MSPRSLSYTFPAGNTTDICQLQTLAGAATLVLNGNLVNQVNGVMSFTNHGYSRSISLTSTNNLSGVNFTIIGIQNGVPISETIAGPNNDTVYGALIYDIITSITTNGAAAAVSVGSGGLGFFPLIQINQYRDVINYTLSLASITSVGTPHTATFGTVSNFINNGSTYLTNVANATTTSNVFVIAAMGANAPSVYSNTGNPAYNQLLVQIGASASATITDAITMNFIQT